MICGWLTCRFQSTHPVWDATSLGAVAQTASRNFNPRIPYGMRHCSMRSQPRMRAFQSTHPVWDATGSRVGFSACFFISIHASRMGCDAILSRSRSRLIRFQSTHPVWDATMRQPRRTISSLTISIHASRMGCDSIRWIHASGSVYFNPRIPYGMRPLARRTSRSMSSFQSTHPVWDATRQERLVVENQDFNPRIPYGMRRVAFALATLDYLNFNPRIPYGMRPDNEMPPTPVIVFQSTHPVWDATHSYDDPRKIPVISIHASRMGCDADTTQTSPTKKAFQSTHPVWDATRRHNQVDASQTNFNPRIPYGMRLEIPEIWEDLKKFQSTHPVWDATVGGLGAEGDFSISIHASRMGCDHADILS